MQTRRFITDIGQFVAVNVTVRNFNDRLDAIRSGIELNLDYHLRALTLDEAFPITINRLLRSGVRRHANQLAGAWFLRPRKSATDGRIDQAEKKESAFSHHIRSLWHVSNWRVIHSSLS